MSLRSTLYVGSVMHRRLRPRRHRLRFRVFWMLLDLDEIDGLASGLRLFSHNRGNVISFYDADHGDGSATPLRDQIERHLAKAGIALDGGNIRLFCMPRIFGYGFNPLSVYFCYHRTGALAAIVYEVHNTFGERHSYLIPTSHVPVDSRPAGSLAADRLADAVIAQHCPKVFYVSPFMDMAMTYQFRVAPPQERISVAISTADADDVMLVAALSGERRTLTDAALLRVVVTHPLLTLRVVGAIHWHALRLWLKGVRLRARPRPPSDPVTIVRAET